MEPLKTRTAGRVLDALHANSSLYRYQLEALLHLAAEVEMPFLYLAQRVSKGRETSRKEFALWTMESGLVESRNDPERPATRLVRLSDDGSRRIAKWTTQVLAGALPKPLTAASAAEAVETDEEAEELDPKTWLPPGVALRDSPLGLDDPPW